jgi:hypothetical protein
MHGMLNRIDSAAAAEAAQLLEAEVVARELLQAVVDKISGACLQQRPILPLLVGVTIHHYPPQQAHTPVTLSSDKYASAWAEACVRSCSSSSLLATDDDVDAHISGGGKQRVKLSFKAAPPVPYCEAVAGVATAAIAAAATAAAAAAVAAAEAEEARLSVHRDFRGKVHIKSTIKSTSPPLPASGATVRP